MERIRKLPFLSGCMASILAGIISFSAGADSQTIYIRMAVMMTVFFILGVYIRNTLYAVKRQSALIKKAKEFEQEQKLKKVKEEKIAEALAAKRNIGNNAKATTTIDMTAGDTNQDGFEPLDFANAIRTKVEE